VRGGRVKFAYRGSIGVIVCVEGVNCGRIVRGHMRVAGGGGQGIKRER